MTIKKTEVEPPKGEPVSFRPLKDSKLDRLCRMAKDRGIDVSPILIEALEGPAFDEAFRRALAVRKKESADLLITLDALIDKSGKAK